MSLCLHLTTKTVVCCVFKIYFLLVLKKNTVLTDFVSLDSSNEVASLHSPHHLHRYQAQQQAQQQQQQQQSGPSSGTPTGSHPLLNGHAHLSPQLSHLSLNTSSPPRTGTPQQLCSNGGLYVTGLESPSSSSVASASSSSNQTSGNSPLQLNSQQLLSALQVVPNGGLCSLPPNARPRPSPQSFYSHAYSNSNSLSDHKGIAVHTLCYPLIISDRKFQFSFIRSITLAKHAFSRGSIVPSHERWCNITNQPQHEQYRQWTETQEGP